MNLELEIRPGRRLYIDINTHSDTKSTAFLIHGLGGRGEQWREQVPLLSERFNLVVPDLLGHGKSDKPKPNKTNPYSFLEHSQDLALIFEKFATNQNIILGHSYGGALATLLAFNHQNKVNQVTLMAPIACQPVNGIPPIYHLPPFVLEWLRPVLEKEFQKLAFAPSVHPSLIEEEMQAGKKNPIYVIKAMLKGMRDIPPLDMLKMHVPLCVILGMSDRVIPVEAVKTYYEAAPSDQVFMLQNAAHMVMLEEPEEVNKVLAKII